jgi:hypothetical protein
MGELTIERDAIWRRLARPTLVLIAAFSLTTGAETPPAAAPAWTGSWSFDGNLSDASGNGQDAYAAQPAFTSGVEGQALRLASAAAEIPDAPGLRLTRGFRLACRMRFASLPAGNAWATVAMKGDHVEGEYFLRVNPASEGRNFGFFVNTGTWEPRVQSRAAVQTGTWYQVEAGWDEKGLWLTVNGDTTRIARAGEPALTYAPLRLGAFDGELDDLRISSPGGCRTSTACWPFEGDLRDASGHGHDFAEKPGAYEPGVGGRALQLGGGPFATPSDPSLQLAPGLHITCSVLLHKLPKNYTSILSKEGEYMLRLDSQEEGGNLAFFVNLDGRWEPRVRVVCRVETGTWYRVSAHWDAQELSLEVNGERAEIVRAGQAKSGPAPLTLGRLDGLIDNLRIENPKLPVIRLGALTTDATLLRAGLSAGLSGVVRNYGNAVTGCVVELKLPPGVACETPAALDLGTLPAGGERSVAWRVRADATASVTATVTLKAAGARPVQMHKTLAFLPPTDPDYSARAWNPPVPTNGSAATYYVDSLAGDNARAGTSPGAAWRDFTPVNGRTLGPGERLLLRRGSVINQELQLSARGTAQAWAELGAYGDGARPVICRNRDIDDRCVLIKNPDYLCIRGLTVCYAGKGLIVHYAEGGHRGLLIEDCIAHHIEGLYRFNAHGIPEWRDRSGAPGDGGAAGGIVASGTGEDIVFRDCETFQCSSGFRFAGKNVFIDRVFCHDNYAHNTSPHPFLTSVSRAYLLNSIFDASGWHAHAGTMGIMLGGQYGLIIRNCHFLNQPDSGSHDQGGIDFEAGGEGCLIDRCTFRNNAGAAIEMLGLKSPQTPNVEIARSRFDRNNVAHKLGPSEIFIWGGSRDPAICCSSGLIRDNGYVLHPGVLFFTNQAPALTRWTLTNNTEYASSKALDKALPYDNPPAVDAGREIWTDEATVRLAGKVSDDGKPKSGRLATAWELLDGPGAVTFRNAAKPATKADFAAPGDYTLRLKADDGELWRSALTAVHVLPPGTAVAKAWTFATPLDKEGWTDWNLGTKDEEFMGQKWSCIARPVRLVAGGEYIVAIKDAPDAHLLSPDALGVDLDGNGLVALRFQNHTPAARMRLRFTTKASPAWEAKLGQAFEVTPNDTAARLYTVDMRGAAGWSGRLKQLRLDFTDGAPLTGTCRIDYLWIGRQR